YEILSDRKKKENYTNPEITVFLEDYLGFLEKNRGIKIWTGAEAFREMLVGIDIEAELVEAKEAFKKLPRASNLEKLKFLQGLQKSSLKLEWIVINDLMVIPCGLRPV